MWSDKCFYSNFPRLLSIVTCSLWESNSLNIGTEEIFPGRILKFGRHFERVEKKLNLSTRDPGHLHACTHARMAQFFLRIHFLVQHMGTSPQVKMASRYGLHPWLWLLLLFIMNAFLPTYPHKKKFMQNVRGRKKISCKHIPQEKKSVWINGLRKKKEIHPLDAHTKSSPATPPPPLKSKMAGPLPLFTMLFWSNLQQAL